MFAGTDIVEFFPSCLWFHEIGDCDPLNQKLMNAVKQLQSDGHGHGHDRSDGGGWTSRTDLLERDAFMPLSEYLIKASEGVLHYLRFKFDHFYVSECWANLNGAGQVHPRHNHPNSVLSGVYYVSAPEACGDIVFYDPRAQAGILHPAVKESTLQNSHRQVVPPADGLLILFPAWLEHSVEQNKSGKERLSISFNVMLTGEIGYETGRIVL
jgi:uncharacterized protein (TIGR02466 family)